MKHRRSWSLGDLRILLHLEKQILGVQGLPQELEFSWCSESAVSSCSDVVIAGSVTLLSWVFLSFWPSKVFPGAQTETTEENMSRDRLVFPLLCSPTGFINIIYYLLPDCSREEALCVPFLLLVVSVAFLCFCLRVSWAGVRGSAGTGIAVPETNTRD